MTTTRLLLVGAGHAHLEVVRRAGELIAAGYEVTLLAPDTFHYSGLASATAAGAVPARQASIDVAGLARAHGVRHHHGLLTALDPHLRTATTDDGVTLGHDVVSLNVGSVVGEEGLEVDDSVVRVKPLAGLGRLAARLAGAPVDGLRVTVVGGGSTGLELAAHLASRPEVGTLVLLEGARIGSDLPRGARRHVLSLLRRRGVQVRERTPVRSIGRDRSTLADGSTVPHDVALLATGLVAPPWLGRLGLGDHRGVPVGPTLRHPEHDHVHAVGDCAHFLPGPLPKIGVHGVRQAPVLVDSLLSRARGGPAPVYRPQRRALAVLDLGDGHGLAVRGRLWWAGGSALRLKRRIDRRWMARYAVPERSRSAGV
ncbi:NAD(P)/FAD-dependent oxidoreductase [Nocardioides coralli]|uniref:NAD(P)/FAD-dependent oxidoreductase n=1 Tax=Nocardioides coralli TaxID=2872154 RepID=UPI001CA3C1FB|nr:FAD-dependent oxidoreductase [Nocardioides coralli]QZY30116.1 FAD-dependent oxidoreductase [Nocardioides coralli]